MNQCERASYQADIAEFVAARAWYREEGVHLDARFLELQTRAVKARHALSNSK